MDEEPQPHELCDPCWRGDHDQCKGRSCMCIDMEHDADDNDIELDWGTPP